jgi:hypothetical protein
MSSRRGIKPPDNQIIPPLPRLGVPSFGPYTITASDELVQDFRIKMSIVTMGQVFAKNISLWGALAHEVGHDITHADKGLLDECAQQVYTGILDAQELKGHTVIYNGITEPFEKRAAEV